jgi:hypothetical protein
MPRYTQPEKGTEAVLDKLKLMLPSQPPPRIKTCQITPSDAVFVVKTS